MDQRKQILSPFALLTIANKVFGFTPEYTLNMEAQTLNAMIGESYYLSQESAEKNKVLRDERGEYEWIDIPTIDGKPKRYKKYKENIKI